MTVLSFATNDKFIFRIRKHHNEDPSTVWYNTYEARANAPGILADLTDVKNILVSFETILLLNTATIDQATISTWEPGLGGYNPGDFVTTVENSVGARPLTGGDDMDLTVALYIRRQAQSGRNGKLFFRNSLLTTDVVTSGGKWRFANPGAMSTLVQGAIDTSTIDTIMVDSVPVQLVMIEESGDNRPISDLLPDRVSTVKLNHIYFDKGEEVPTLLAAKLKAAGISIEPGQRIRVVRKRGTKLAKS